MKIEVYCDGICLEKNPGGEGYVFYVIITNGGLFNVSIRRIGKGPTITNNKMEYRAILSALKHVYGVEFKNSKLIIYSDSQLAVNQILGHWAVNDAELDKLRQQVLEEIRKLKEERNIDTEIQWVEREKIEKTKSIILKYFLAAQ